MIPNMITQEEFNTLTNYLRDYYPKIVNYCKETNVPFIPEIDDVETLFRIYEKMMSEKYIN